jgi:hypothetical protein
MAPTFVPRYVGPGFYVKQQDISTPNVPQGVFIPAIIGQGAKTLVRQQNLVKGVDNGTDGPLDQNIVIDILSIVDQNNVVYVKGTDFQLTRPTPTTASIDWSLQASLTGTVDLTTLTYPGDLEGLHLKVNLNGAPQDIVFTVVANAADVAFQINQWVGSTIASLGAGNLLVLSANSIAIEEGDANIILGFITGQFASVQEPAEDISYQVTYTSDKLATEYLPQLFSNMNSLASYHGAIRVAQELFSGSVVSAGANTLDTGLTLAVNELVGNYIKITGGTGNGQVRVIIANTAVGVLTLSQDWSTGNPPTAGSDYRITDVNDNSITLGSQTSFDAGATFIITSQYAEDLFDSSNIKAAIDNLAVDIKGQRPYCLVLMRGLGATEVSPIIYLKNHCNTYSDIPQNKYRIAIVGLAQGNDDFTTFTQLANGTKARRVTIVDISDIQKDFGDGNGLATLDGSYVAAALAGIVCANVDAGEPITFKSMGSVFDVDTFSDPFLVSEKDQMASAGITVIERRGVDLIVRHALTTDNTTIFTQELKLTRAADFISNYLRSNLENTLTGKRFVVSSTGQGDVVLLAKSMFVTLLDQLKNPQAQIATRIEDPSVTQNETEKRQLDFKANIFLTTDVIWEYALLGFSV